MKYITFFFLLTFLATSATIEAQDLGKTSPEVKAPAPAPMDEVAPPILPAKQVILLYEVNDMEEPEMVDNPEDPEAELMEEQLDEQVFNLNILLHLFSSGNVAKIHTKVGTSPGAADHAQYSFAFDVQKGLPAPFTFARDGKTVVLGMGEVKGLPTYHVEVVLEGLDGKRSEARYYSPE